MSSPQGKTRKTVTHRAPQTKILQALDQIRDLVERHCGESKEAMQKTARAAAQQALEDSMAQMKALQAATAKLTAGLTAKAVSEGTIPPNATYAELPATLPAATLAALPEVANIPATAAKMAVPNPTGPSEWNQFMLDFKVKYEADARARGNDRKKIPYMEILKAGKEAYAAKKAGEGKLEKATTAKAAVNINALVAPLTQRLQTQEEKRRQLAAKIEVYKTAYPEQAKEINRVTRRIGRANNSRADLNAAIAALRGKKLTAKQTRKAQNTLRAGLEQMNAQNAQLNLLTQRLNNVAATSPGVPSAAAAAVLNTSSAAVPATRKTKKTKKRVRTMNNEGMTPRNEAFFNVEGPAAAPAVQAAAAPNAGLVPLVTPESVKAARQANRLARNAAATAQSMSTLNEEYENSAGTPELLQQLSLESLGANPNNNALRKVALEGSTQAEAEESPSTNANSNFRYNNEAANNLGIRKVTINKKKYYMSEDGSLIERGNEENNNAMGSNIVGVWKNGSIQPYVEPSEE